MRLCSIASGSSGNCIYVGSDATHLLVDTGISGKRMVAGVESLGIKPSELDGILITHEHSDHISGLGILARKYEIPIYTTKETYEAIKQDKKIGLLPEGLFHEVKYDEKFTLKDMEIYPVKISHDAKKPVAYRVSSENKKVGILTDLGNFNDYIVECMSDLDAVLLEANHDVNMLQVGPYPYYLKQRILGDRGHLSNVLCGRLLDRILHNGTKHVVLGHLSKENNYEALAYEAVRLEITMGDNPYKAEDFPMYVAKRDTVSPMIRV